MSLKPGTNRPFSQLGLEGPFPIDDRERLLLGSVQHGLALSLLNGSVRFSLPGELVSNLLQHQRGIGAAESEAVGHHRMEFHVILLLAKDRKTIRVGIDLLDVCGGGQKAAVPSSTGSKPPHSHRPRQARAR